MQRIQAGDVSWSFRQPQPMANEDELMSIDAYAAEIDKPVLVVLTAVFDGGLRREPIKRDAAGNALFHRRDIRRAALAGGCFPKIQGVPPDAGTIVQHNVIQ